jgi:PEP-CTERM/exosortase A-associated glycosyltransferase
VTSPLHQLDDPDAKDTTLDDVVYRRTPISGPIADFALRHRSPVLREWQVVHLLREQILRIASTHRPDIIYAHSPALCGLAALQAAQTVEVPFVYEIRAFWEDAASQNVGKSLSVRSQLTRRLETYVSQKASAVAGISKPILADIASRGIPKEKLFHVPNGVNTTRFVPAPKDADIAQGLRLSDRFVFGFFGSLYHYEGVSWMLRAASDLWKRNPTLAFLIIGSGEDRAGIERAVRDSSATGYVHIIDHVPHEQIARYYSCVDVVVCPRRSLRLTELVTPLKPLEAMALGKPVLASDIGGIRELVEHGVTGLLFQPGDETDFCRQAEKLISSPALRERLSEQGRSFVVKERDWKIVARRYRELYEFVLSRNAADCGITPHFAEQSQTSASLPTHHEC